MTRYIIFLLIILSFACQEPQSSNDLFVATASNAQFAIEEIVTDFESKFDWKCHIVLGSSGKLTAQIEQGAPYDVFLSADQSYPNYLIEKGKTIGPSIVYAEGNLVLWTINKELPANLIAFYKKSVTIAIANPMSAPYGQAAKHYLLENGVWDKIQPNLVFAESISQVNQMLVSGAVDYAFTAESVVASPKLKAKGIWVAIPKTYPVIKQAAVLLNTGNAKAQAQKDFATYLQSEAANKIWRQFGYQ